MKRGNISATEYRSPQHVILASQRTDTLSPESTRKVRLTNYMSETFNSFMIRTMKIMAMVQWNVAQGKM